MPLSQSYLDCVGQTVESLLGETLFERESHSVVRIGGGAREPSITLIQSISHGWAPARNCAARTRSVGRVSGLMASVSERLLGLDHPTVATRLNNLAQLLKATNRLADAEPLYKRALRIMERPCGSDHPNTETVDENLATCVAEIKAQKKH